MILTDETKHKPGDGPPASEAPGPSGSTSTSGSSIAAMDDTEPPPYSPERDPHVDLLEGEPPHTLHSAAASPIPSPFPATQPISNIPPHLPRQNRLRVYRDNSGISDTYVIDPTLPAPPGSHDKALSLYSQNGSVEGTVYLTKAPGKVFRGRAELEALSLNGSIRFRVAECPPDMRISIVAESRNGSIALYLPPTFRGPLTITHSNGSAAFTPSLKARTRTLDETHDVHRCWVGEWGEEDDGEEGTDIAVVASHNGSVKVGYWSQEEADKQQVPKGILEKAFGKKG